MKKRTLILAGVVAALAFGCQSKSKPEPECPPDQTGQSSCHKNMMAPDQPAASKEAPATPAAKTEAAGEKAPSAAPVSETVAPAAPAVAETAVTPAQN